jgi:hypothetical protein
MEKRLKVIIGSLIILAVATSVVAGGLWWLTLPVQQVSGTLYFNDSGESHGGFEMACQWNISLTVRGGMGVLVATPEPDKIGNEALEKWSYTVTGFKMTPELAVMALDGDVLELPFVENDTVWNQFHNQYIVATPSLSPTIFPGFLSHYYVELRLFPLPL